MADLILIAIPEIKIKSIFDDYVIINGNIDNSHLYIHQIQYKEIKVRRWNIINIKTETMSRNKDYKIKGLHSNTKYEFKVCSLNKYGICGISSSIFKFKTTSWKVNDITYGFSDCIEDHGYKFLIKRNPNNNWSTLDDKLHFVTASCLTGYNSGIHKFQIKCIGILSVIEVHFVLVVIYIIIHIHIIFMNLLVLMVQLLHIVVLV
eukprot:276957_1